MEIVTLGNKSGNKILRKKTAGFDFGKFAKADLKKLVREMRAVMKGAQGIGLSANQVGLDLNFFIAEVAGKFYAIFNPKIEKLSEEKDNADEGCLSVPETFGEVARPSKVTLSGIDINGKKVKIKAWGLLARVFQHEVDHLNGNLFIDCAKNIEKIKNQE